MEIGIALGYLNREELTKEKFIENPFGEGRIYKTGDLTVLLPGGCINYIGRIDNQVKLRGFRIELSEIDAKILEFKGIKESVTIINSNMICSYIVTKEKIAINDLVNHLRKILPSYMVPTFIKILDNIPMNANGKADKKQLPPPDFNGEGRRIIPARNKIDEEVINELKDILHLENISIEDSFFGIGGDSLNAITLCTHLSDKLKTSVSVKDVFDNPVIKHLSDFITENMKNSKAFEAIITKAEEKKYYPVSSAQRRMYYANTVTGNNTIVYNVSGGILFEKKLEEEKVKKALKKLVNLHSSFRTVFTYEEGQLVQSILDDVQIDLEIETSSLEAQTIVNKFPKPFNLSKAPLLRAKLVYLANNTSLLLLDSHHIVLDRNFTCNSI